MPLLLETGLTLVWKTIIVEYDTGISYLLYFDHTTRVKLSCMMDGATDLMLSLAVADIGFFRCVITRSEVVNLIMVHDLPTTKR